MLPVADISHAKRPDYLPESLPMASTRSGFPTSSTEPVIQKHQSNHRGTRDEEDPGRTDAVGEASV